MNHSLAPLFEGLSCYEANAFRSFFSSIHAPVVTLDTSDRY